MASIDDLIQAIGRAEGWGLERDGSGQWRMKIFNASTTAPFGLLGDTTAFPQLARDPQLLYEFVRGKITGIVSPRVKNELGVQGFSSTVVPGLVTAAGDINTALIPVLAMRWAPLDAKNDPNKKNYNWLSNVLRFLPKSFNIEPPQTGPSGSGGSSGADGPISIPANTVGIDTPFGKISIPWFRDGQLQSIFVGLGLVVVALVGFKFVQAEIGGTR